MPTVTVTAHDVRDLIRRQAMRKLAEGDPLLSEYVAAIVSNADHIAIWESEARSNDRKLHYINLSMKNPGYTLPEDIDTGIRPLVFALNGIGIKTMSSCEGHNEDNPKFTMDLRGATPFVSIWLDDLLSTPEGKKLGEVIQEFNKKSSVKWKLSEIVDYSQSLICGFVEEDGRCHNAFVELRPERDCVTRGDINAAHKNISELADFIVRKCSK